MAKDSFASAHLHWQRRGPSQSSPKGFRRGLFGRSVKCGLRCTNDLLRPCNCGSRRPSVSATTVADIRATGLVIDDAGRERLVAAGIFVGVLDRRRLATLAYLIQLAVLLNVALVLWEAVDYTLTRSLANFAHTAYYVLERPGGLWVQPNDAAIALLFGALLSFWARGPRPVIWLARAGSVVAIFLTASR